MYRPEWLQYTQEQRQTLSEHYNMKRTTSTEVVGNTLVCDGFADAAIYELDKKKTDKILGLTEDKPKNDEKPKAKKKGTNKKGASTKSKKKQSA